MSPLSAVTDEFMEMEKEILTDLSKTKNDKSLGLDDISVMLYKHISICRQLLIELLQKVWWDEEVSIDFVMSSFVMVYKNKGSER